MLCVSVGVSCQNGPPRLTTTQDSSACGIQGRDPVKPACEMRKIERRVKDGIKSLAPFYSEKKYGGM